MLSIRPRYRLHPLDLHIMAEDGRMEHRLGAVLIRLEMGLLLQECLVVPGCRAHREGRGRHLGVQGPAR